MADQVEVEIVPKTSQQAISEIKSTLSSALSAVAGGVVGGAGSVMAIVGTVKRMFQDIVPFIEKANPAVVERLQFAWDDLYAVIGHSLIPVVELVTSAVQMFGDFLATIAPSTEVVRAALAGLSPALDGFRGALGYLAEALKPVMDGIVEFIGFVASNWEVALVALSGLAGVIVALGVNAGIAIASLIGLTGAIAALMTTATLGVAAIGAAVGVAAGVATVAALKAGVGGGDKLKSSMGAAASRTSFVGISELGKQAQLKTLASGVQPGKTVAQMQLEAMQKVEEHTRATAGNTKPRDPSKDRAVSGAQKG